MNRITLLCTPFLLLAACSSQDTAQLQQQPAEAPERKVFIDPETGRVRAPTAQDLPPETADRRTSPDAEKSEKFIVGPDGRKFLIHDRSDWTELKAEQNANGDLNIEHSQGAR